MQKINITSTLTKCTMEELDDNDRKLVENAIEASTRSYSIYSHFSVGAAIRLEDGTIIMGCNQENAAYTPTICAERSAIFAAGAQHPDTPIVAIAIAARNSEGLVEDPITPCGVCRQVMIEVEHRYHRPLHILLYGKRCVYMIEGIGNLMPLSFSDEAL